METTELMDRIARLAKLSAGERPNWREAWTLVREINQGFKELRFPKPEDCREAWANFQAIVQTMKTRQDAERRASEEVKCEIAEKLGQVERDMADARKGVIPWRQVWDEIGAVRAALKQVLFPSKADREAAWAQLNKIADLANTHREEWVAWKDESADLKNEILCRAEAARPVSELEKMLALSFMLPFLLIETLIDTVFELISGCHFDRAKEELQGMNQMLAQAWREFGEHKAQMSGRDKHEVYEFLMKVGAEVKDAWARYKGQRAEFNQARRCEWREKVESRIEQHESKLADLHEKRRIARERLDEAEEKLATAWSDSYHTWAEGRVHNLEEWIEKLEALIDRVEGWLAEDRAKLNEV